MRVNWNQVAGSSPTQMVTQRFIGQQRQIKVARIGLHFIQAFTKAMTTTYPAHGSGQKVIHPMKQAGQAYRHCRNPCKVYIKQGSPYVALRRSKPIYAGYLDLSNIYISTDGIDLCVIAKEGVKDDSRSILRIMSDQLDKAWKCEPFVFSLSPYKNLLFKNLSMQEVRVIGAELSITEYYDVLMIYYKTYLMAIQIADDGERNAKRHAFWQISLAQRFGVDFAIKLGNAHEEGRPGTAEDNRVDEINNKNALEYNAGHPGIDPKEAADTMWEEGLIVGYKKDVAPEHAKDEF